MSDQIDILWMIVCSVLVLLMQAGFCCLESGLVRSKNTINVALKNLVDLCLCSIVFLAVGFGLMFGSSVWGVFGFERFFFHGSGGAGADVFLLFQVLFCGTAVTIVSGAVAERMSFLGYVIIAVLTAALIYPIVGHSVWGPAGADGTLGWLRELGFRDFAGSTVVHSTGGWIALAAVLIIGPRSGSFDALVTSRQSRSYPLAALGTLLLWFGWIGFNAGSTLAFNDRVPGIILCTFFAGCAGGLVTIAIMMKFPAYANALDVLNGCLAGLVAVTASANMISIEQSLVFGGTGALIYLAASRLLLKLKIDDVVGAIPVHLAAGIWGTLVVPFALPASALDESGGLFSALTVQSIGIVASGVWVFGVSLAAMHLLNRMHPLRVTIADEKRGLDLAEHGISTEYGTLERAIEAQNRNPAPLRAVNIDPDTEVGQLARLYNDAVELFETTLDELRGNLAQSESANGLLRTRTVDLEKALVDRNAQVNRSKARMNETLEKIDTAISVFDGDREKRAHFLGHFSSMLTQQLNEIVMMANEAAKKSNGDPKKLAHFYHKVTMKNVNLRKNLDISFEFLRASNAYAPDSEEPVDINALVFGQMERRKKHCISQKIELRSDFGDRLPKLYACQSQMAMVFGETIGFLIGRSESGDSVVISTSSTPTAGLAVSILAKGSRIATSVAGLATAAAGAKDASYDGRLLETSVSLALAKRLVLLHDGNMIISTTPPKVAKIEIIFPQKRTTGQLSPENDDEVQSVSAG